MTELRAQVESVLAALRGEAIAPTSELSLTRFVERRLTAAGIEFKAEVVLSRTRDEAQESLTIDMTSRQETVRLPKIRAVDRIDFMVGKVGLELKIKGSWPEVARQLDRYAASADIGALVLVTSRRRLASNWPLELRGKPFFTIHVGTL